MLIEYPDIEERRRALAKLKGVEDRVWVQVEGTARVYAVADEDLERENAEKTSSVHFLRFELDDIARRLLRGGAGLRIGVDHSNYRAEVEASPETTASLLKDLKP
jgi:hypothetical protein